MKILIIAATHGNEPLGIDLLDYILRERPQLYDYIDVIVGNPRAYANNVRYTESDLNRSYGLEQPATYEQQRAREIEAYIERTQPNLVIDMHTTTTVQPNIIILSNPDHPQVRRFLRASHLDRILCIQTMQDITTIANNVVAYEIPNDAISTELLSQIADDLERYVRDEVFSSAKQFYQMIDKIYKHDVSVEDFATFVNFEMHTLGFVPIMTGENSYKRETDYYGFKSGAPRQITL
jgi:succinylglutamate desuccinylase